MWRQNRYHGNPAIKIFKLMQLPSVQKLWWRDSHHSDRLTFHFIPRLNGRLTAPHGAHLERWYSTTMAPNYAWDDRGTRQNILSEGLPVIHKPSTGTRVLSRSLSHGRGRIYLTLFMWKCWYACKLKLGTVMCAANAYDRTNVRPRDS